MINYEKYNSLMQIKRGNLILANVVEQYESLVKINYRPNEYSTIANTIHFNILNINHNINSHHEQGWESERQQLNVARNLLDEALGIIMKLEKKQNEIREKAIKERESA